MQFELYAIAVSELMVKMVIKSMPVGGKGECDGCSKVSMEIGS